MKRTCLIIFLLSIFFTYGLGTIGAGEKPGRAGEIRKGIQAEGACAIVGMSAEQSSLTALQRARAAAIERTRRPFWYWPGTGRGRSESGICFLGRIPWVSTSFSGNWRRWPIMLKRPSFRTKWWQDRRVG